MLFKKANANENEVHILKRDIIEETRCLIKCLPLLCVNFSAFWLRHWCYISVISRHLCVRSKRCRLSSGAYECIKAVISQA